MAIYAFTHEVIERIHYVCQRLTLEISPSFYLQIESLHFDTQFYQYWKFHRVIFVPLKFRQICPSSLLE